MIWKNFTFFLGVTIVAILFLPGNELSAQSQSIQGKVFDGENYESAVASMGSDDINTKVWWEK